MSHQRLKTETDQFSGSTGLAKPQQNNYFADVVQASQGGLGGYKSVKKTSSMQ